MKTLITGGIVIDYRSGNNHLFSDILVENDRIVAVINNQEQREIEAEKIIDATGKLVIPGLINAHMHSETNLQKGLFESLPLEVWLPNVVPVFGSVEVSCRLVYLSALLGSIHMLKSGVTTVIDHWIDNISLEEGFVSVVQAYTDVGIRAVVGIDFSDRSLLQELPLLENYLPTHLKKLFYKTPSSNQNYITLIKKLANLYGAKNKRVHAMLGFSSVPRCSNDLLEVLGKISLEYGLNLHGHILETRIQKISAEQLYKQGIVKHLDEMGLLSPALTLAHSIWVNREEAYLMGEKGVSIVHNPVSNLKLGSGIMPLELLNSEDLNIALGTDGASSNDNLNLFEVMKLTAIIHTQETVDFLKWPKSSQVFKYATFGGARSAGLEKQIGVIEVGKKADLVILNTDNTTFIPLNDPVKQLVYCETGSSVSDVLVDGALTVEGGEVKNVNEEVILREIKDIELDFRERLSSIASNNQELIRCIESMYFHHMCR